MVEKSSDVVKTDTEKALEKSWAQQRTLDALRAQVKRRDGKNPLVVKNLRELRTVLHLEDIRMRLFGRSLWHLDNGDRHPKQLRLIRVSARDVDGRRGDLSIRVMDLPTKPNIKPEKGTPTSKS